MHEADLKYDGSDSSQTDLLQERIMDLFTTGKEALIYLNEVGLEKNEKLLRDIKELCISLGKAIAMQYSEIKLKNKLVEIAYNVSELVDQMLEDLSQEKVKHAEMVFCCSFTPLFFFWEKYALYFLTCGKGKEMMEKWYQNEREQQKKICYSDKNQKSDREYIYDLSVVVLFYGHREMTKQCLDAIKKYTKGHSYELITFDNGSDEETAAWCEGLSHIKKIRYPYNMGSSVGLNLILSMAQLYAEGKYLLYISNDVIVTPHYDEILYNCLESDPKIALASPVCNSASNFQAIGVPYPQDDLDAMWKFAEGFNHCDSHKWKDRARLFQILGCYRLEALQKLYLGFDPLFCYDMFADDDHSCNLRRMGYRQVLCHDVFVHHYGSSTIGKNQYNVMDLGREQFYQKHGVDAWNSLGMDLYWSVQGFTISKKNKLNVLVVNPCFGESALALKNQLRICGCDQIEMDALTEDPRYLPDIDAMYRCGGELKDETSVLVDQIYDIAMVGIELQKCKDLSSVLHVVAQRLKVGGIFITQHGNPFSAEEMFRFFIENNSKDTPYLHDLKTDPLECYLTNEILHSMMQREGMVCRKTVAFTQTKYEEQVNSILSALPLENSNEIKKRTLISNYFNLWSKEQV